MDRYSNITHAVLDQPWAILPETYAQIVSLVQLRNAGITLTRADVEARIGGDGRERPATDVQGDVGILPVFGVLAQRMNMFQSISGGTSTEQLAAEFCALRDDDHVKAVLMVIDSPGGNVYGIEELGDVIRASRGRKPIIALADSLAASGAYWLGAQADQFFVTTGGDVGSIGVVMAHTDVSAAAEKAGVKTTLTFAGPYKVEGHPFGPLTEEAQSVRQSRVDTTYARFIKAVAAGRRVSEASVRTGFGQGRVVSAQDALTLGMVDGVQTFAETLAQLQHQAMPAPSGRRVTATESPSAAAPRQTPPAVERVTSRMPDTLWRALIESDL